MILHVYVEDKHYPLDVPAELLQDAVDFFTRIDADMEQGWQMSRQWVERPNARERVQIVADKLLGALETENPQMISLMGAYMLWKLPGLQGLRIDSGGEMQETELIMGVPA